MKLRRFDLLVGELFKKLEWIGIAAVLAMMLVTVIDVVGAKVFLSPLNGAMEMISFGQIVAISCVLAVGLLFGRHIDIELFVSWMSKSIQNHIHFLISIIGFIFFIILAWQSTIYGLSLQKAGEISSSAYIPLFPFAYVIAFCAAAASLYYLNEIFHYFAERSARHGSH
ncbi:MAG TPA: TRAP transporter small permease [Firmicutes bacterium]|nr:TRAP transporter small permease [Bacillota bacterium]